MSVLIHLLADCHRKQQHKSNFTRMVAFFGRLSEPFWFVLSFVLFLVMGPFSIIAVVAGLHHLATNTDNQKSPEPASC